MSTVSEIAKLIAVTRGRGNDLMFQELLKPEIISFDAVLRKQDFDKTLVYKEEYIQTIKALPLRKVRATELDSCIDEYILKSVYKVPSTLPVARHPFVSVYNSVAGRKRTQISFIPNEEVGDIKDRQFSSNDVYYTVQDRFVYVINNFNMTHLSIRLLLSNPLDAISYTQEVDDASCFDAGDYTISEFNMGLILRSFSNAKTEE